jgi:BirA family biotin operon repressor/biotin-[acetyl-CoA-carboxylase] ligase
MTNPKNSEEASLPHKRICLLGKEIYHYRELSSTNSIARHMAQSGAPEGTIVMSRVQTAGRGRMARQWTSPPGKGILMSLILRPDISIQFVPQLTLLSGVAVAETIRNATGCAAGIKWPNDVVLKSKKLCGILAESSFSKGAPDWVVIGFGININLDPDDLPPDCQTSSTSLKIELGHRVSRLNILSEFINVWEKHYQGFLKGGHDYLRPHWIQNNVTLGKSVTVSREKESFNGVAVDISERGGLVVRLTNGDMKEFLAEDVSIGRHYYGTDDYPYRNTQ